MIHIQKQRIANTALAELGESKRGKCPYNIFTTQEWFLTRIRKLAKSDY
jgi:hypothetical protein